MFLSNLNFLVGHFSPFCLFDLALSIHCRRRKASRPRHFPIENKRHLNKYKLRTRRIGLSVALFPCLFPYKTDKLAGILGADISDTIFSFSSLYFITDFQNILDKPLSLGYNERDGYIITDFRTIVNGYYGFP